MTPFKRHGVVQYFVSLLVFYKLGLWQRDRETTTKEKLLKWSCSIYFLSLIVSLFVGAFSKTTTEDIILLAVSAISAFVLWVKLNFVLWKETEILHCLNEVCVYTTSDREGFTIVTDKLQQITKFITAFIWKCCSACFYSTVVSPFMGDRKALFFDIAFPLDHKNDEIAFWIALVYLVLAVIAMIFNVLMWYLLYSCALRFKLIERQIANIGCNLDDPKLSNHQYNEDLMAAVKAHGNTKETADLLDSFFSRIFIASFVTAGISICCSLYCLIEFHRSTNVSGQIILLTLLLYSVFDVFMLTYFGNEIKLSSDRFTYCLFESNWIGKPKSIIRSVLIFGELLMRPYEIFVFKLYPLSLETFTRILNSVYSMFNILKNFK